MALDKNGKVLNNYTYDIAKKAVSEGRDELIILYNGVEYHLCVCSRTLIGKLLNISNSYKYLDDPFAPYWCFCTKNGDIIAIAPKETIMDELRIDGHSLEEIWDKIILL